MCMFSGPVEYVRNTDLREAIGNRYAVHDLQYVLYDRPGAGDDSAAGRLA